jgi:hypothetical protein
MELYSVTTRQHFEAQVLMAAGNSSLYSLVYLASNQIVLTDGLRSSTKAWFAQDFLKVVGLDLTSQYCIFLSEAGIVFLFPLYIVRDSGYDTEWTRFVSSVFIDFYTNRDSALEDWLQGFGECVQRRRHTASPDNLLDVMCLKVHSKHPFTSIRATTDLLVLGTQGGEVFVVSPFEGTKISSFKFPQSVLELKVLRLQPLVLLARTLSLTYLIEEADKADKKRHKTQEYSNVHELSGESVMYSVVYQDTSLTFTSLCSNAVTIAKGRPSSPDLELRLLPAQYISLALWNSLVVVFSVEDLKLTANLIDPVKGVLMQSQVASEVSRDCICLGCSKEIYKPLDFKTEKWVYTEGMPLLQSCPLASQGHLVHVNSTADTLHILTQSHLFEVRMNKLEVGRWLWEAARSDDYVSH